MTHVLAVLDPVWAPPLADAPRLQHDAYATMMSLISRADAVLPELLSRPQAHPGDVIMQQAISASLNAGIDRALLNSAIELLHARVSTFQPGTKLHLVLPELKRFNALSSACGARLSILCQFVKLLEEFIARLEREVDALGDAAEPPTEKGDAPGASKMNPDIHAGLLAALLVIRSGQCSMQVIGQVLAGLDRRVTVAGVWSWVDVRLAAGRGYSQVRRIFLDPITMAAFVRFAATVKPVATGDSSNLKRRARSAFSALKKAIGWTDSEGQTLTLDELVSCQRDWLHVHACPLLSSYSGATVVHSSLSEDTWLRLIGYELDADDSDVAVESSASVPGEGALPLVTDPTHESSRDFQIQAGDIDSDLDSAVCRLREIMRSPFPEWGPALNALADTQPVTADGDPSTAYLMVRWLHHLTLAKINTGTRLAPSTINQMRGLIANRALSLLPEYLHDLDADQLTEAYTEVVEDASSEQLRPRIAAALAQFDRYVRTDHLPDIPKVRLSGFEGGLREVNALIVSEAEYLRMLSMTTDGTIAYRSEREAMEDRAFLVLGFRFGLRRSEILGLQARDIRLGPEPVLLIRANAWRSLKTRNAVRTLPLGILSQSELKILSELRGESIKDVFVFFRNEPPSLVQLRDHKVVPRVRELLKRVAPHGRRLHPHNLRHSFASLNLLGMIADDVGAAGSPYLESWMVDSIASARRFAGRACGSLHHFGGRGSALGTAAGHGSELTTYEHYVHVLDVLLFLSCTTSRMMERDEATGTVSIRRGETKLINAMFGYHPSRGLGPDGIASIFRAQARRNRSVVRLATASRGSSSSTPSAELSASVSIDDLRSSSPDESARGYPRDQAPRDTVNAILHVLNNASAHSATALNRLLTDWCDRQCAEPDWAYFNAADAKAFITSATKLGLPASTSLDVKLDIFCSSTRRHHLAHLEAADLSAAFRRGQGTFLLRFRDRRDGATTERSRTQSSVTWTLRAFLEVVSI